MKTFLIFAIAALIGVQLTAALPRPQRPQRLRRSAPSFEPTPDMNDFEKLMLFGVSKFFDFANVTAQSYKNFFEKVIEKAENSKINLEKETAELKDYVKYVEQLDKYEGEELFEKTFDIFEKNSGIVEKYDLDEVKNPTDEQKEMSKLMEENGLFMVSLEFLGHLSGLRDRLIDRIDLYSSRLTPAEKRKQRKFLSWTRKFKKETDFEKHLELMVEFFSFME